LTVSAEELQGCSQEAKGLDRGMKKIAEFVLNLLVAGALVVVPIYLASLLLLNAVNSSMHLVQPFAKLLPRFLPAIQLLSLAFLLMLCLPAGSAVRTPVGRTTWERIEKSLFQRMPFFGLFRSLSFAPHLVSGAYMHFQKPSIILIILIAGFARADTTFGPSSSEQQEASAPMTNAKLTREFGKSYDTLRPEQKKLVDDYIGRYNQTKGSRIVAREAYDNARISVRTTFDAVTHALIQAKMTNTKGTSLGRAFDLVDAVDEILGEEADVGGDRQFRLYVYLKPEALETLSQSREFHRDRDNTVYHKGFPACFRLKDGPPSIQISISRNRRMADIDVDYRSSTFPKALFNGHLTASNSDVRAGDNLDRHDRRWSGLTGWWRELFGSFAGKESQAKDSSTVKRNDVPLNPPVKAEQGIDESAHDFLKSWVVDKHSNLAIAYFAKRSYPCLEAIARRDRKPILPGMVRVRLRLSMDTFAASLTPSKEVGEVFEPDTSWYPNLRDAKNAYASEFRLVSVPSGMGQDYECTPISDEESSKKHKEKYFATVVRGKQGDSRNKVMSLLWAEEGRYWKVVAIRIEDGSTASILPKTASKTLSDQNTSPEDFTGDPNAVNDITDFYKSWLISRNPAEAAHYASERSYSCIGPASQAERKMKPVDRIRIGLERPLAKIPEGKKLSEVMHGSRPVNELVRAVEHVNSEGFSIMAVPEQLADSFLCQGRKKVPPEIQAKDARYGKYYLSASQLNLDGEESPALLLLWALEKERWKVIAWAVEEP